MSVIWKTYINAYVTGAYASAIMSLGLAGWKNAVLCLPVVVASMAYAEWLDSKCTKSDTLQDDDS